MIPLLSTAALADPLWVEADQVDAVRATVDALWPDAPIEVLARPDELQGEGLLWVGGLLVWIHEGRAWTERAEDATTAVLLARSWSRSPPVAEVELPPEAPPAPPPPPEEPVPAERLWLASLGVQGSDGLDGLRIGGSGMVRHLELGASLFVSTRGAASPSALEANLDALQLVTVLEARDVVSVGGQATWHFVSRPTTDAPRIGPVGVAGLQVGERVSRELSDDGITFAATSQIGLGALAGAGADVWLTPRWALLGTVADRIDLDRAAAQRILMAVDLRVVLP
ncbi:MAG: hypothetical protein H6738_22270 [Alphaproteobacteria bacterium]|nr:hypothetical protein [Alphaproteobacteria bacterium]MCB9699526.1 hypothetical protein [Alphaproteobacteria bacterium]